MPALSVFLPVFILYAITVAAGIWFVLPPEIRRQIQRRLKSTSSKGVLMGSELSLAPSRLVLAVTPRLAACCISVLKQVKGHRKSALLASALLLLPTLCVLLFGTRNALDGYGDPSKETDPVIAALLQGEQLVPPPPLPPELFITKDLVDQRTSLATANRDWERLDPAFRQRLLMVYRLMAMHGYQMALIEGYRSPERQYALAKLGPHVTNVGAYQSYHQYGLAADSAFYEDGKIVISEKEPRAMEGYRLFGKYAESVGLVWGGQWKMMDFGHVELHKLRVQPKN